MALKNPSPKQEKIVTALRLTNPQLISNHYRSSYLQNTFMDVKRKWGIKGKTEKET